jgi:hypothetical protein
MQQRNRSKHEMATNNRGRGGRNNNPEGRNQYSGMIGTARANPLSTAAAVGGAVAAGVFLWTRRNQISDQLGNLTDQISGWRETMQPGDDAAPGSSTSEASFVTAPNASARGEGRTQAQIAEEALTLKEIGETV